MCWLYLYYKIDHLLTYCVDCYGKCKLKCTCSQLLQYCTVVVSGVMLVQGVTHESRQDNCAIQSDSSTVHGFSLAVPSGSDICN